jgi:hypothetical protein
MNAIADNNRRAPSLYEIERSLQMLMQDREETQDPEELAAIDAAIQEYIGKEISKVDRVRAYIRYCESKEQAAKQAAAEATSYAQIWANRISRVRAAAVVAMEATGAKRLEGTAGSLSIRGNGGVQPLFIDNPELLPDDCCRMEGWIDVDIWEWICRSYGAPFPDTEAQMKRVPDNVAIRARLLEDCPTCGGHGWYADGDFSKSPPEHIQVECEACGGTGKQGVPGAHLGERGISLVVR